MLYNNIMKRKIYTKGGEKMRIGIYPNLFTEQAKRSMTDVEVAEKIGISTRTYSRKKQIGGFKGEEITALCKLFNGKYEYLFMMNPPTH